MEGAAAECCVVKLDEHEAKRLREAADGMGVKHGRGRLGRHRRSTLSCHATSGGLSEEGVRVNSPWKSRSLGKPRPGRS